MKNIEFDIDNFGQWLTNELEKTDMQLIDFAYKAGVTPQSLCGYKRNYRTPTLRSVQAIVNALGYDLVLVKKGE